MISADVESFPDVSHSTVYHILWCTRFPRTLIPVNFLVSFVSDLQYIPDSYQTTVVSGWPMTWKSGKSQGK